MEQMALWKAEARVWAVADLTRYVRELLESDYRLQDVWVGGEVSNVSRPASGHLYFTLKDAQASLRCVMWRSDAARQIQLPRDGEAVEAHGRLSVYEAGGQYQLYADELRPAGEGALFQEFLRRKARLQAEGLFDPARKRPLPAWPLRIGLVTSPSGAALRDVINVLRRRFPLGEVILAPTPVQGADAPAGITLALQSLNLHSRPDVILLVRGGGSLEDLWAFNDETVARAIVASTAPVVTGIGHETDFTIADFAADVRAPTPSAAAELITPDRVELAAGIRATGRSITATLLRRIERLRWDLADRRSALQMLSPGARLAGGRQRVDDLGRRAAAVARHAQDLRRSGLHGLEQALRAVNPLAVLARGYAVVRRADNQLLIRSIHQISGGEQLDVRVGDGSFPAEALSRRTGRPGRPAG